MTEHQNKQTLSARELVAARRAQASPPSVVKPTAAVAVTDNRTYHARYLDEVAPASIVGRMVKFSKDGAFVTHDDGRKIDEDADFIALVDETLIGWVKFNEAGAPPDREMGLLYDGFVMPKRESLGDLDESKWDDGLDGKPADPWQHHQYLVLQSTDTAELFTFVTSSKTGRRAIGNLIRHYDGMRTRHPGELPVVRLRPGGFKHKEARVGFVACPVFSVRGHVPRDSAAKPDTSVGTLLDDVIPF